ncbi:S-layer homology domain-containing protein, partial [Anaerovorax odorimutans]|uniref:S-layer homology domain-containing protein n=1 Tax=Anaerovorax odorimutans TaxID=109327 RepID=UPI00146F7E74
SYNPNVAGSYTFTATLGSLPTGYANTGNYTATVEIIVNKQSSSGGHSSSSSNTTITSTKVIVNGEDYNAGSTQTESVNGNMVTTVTLDTEKIVKLLDSKDAKPVVTIPVINSSDTISGVLNGQMVKSMENIEATLKIETASATYTLPASQINIDSVSQQLGTQIELKDINVQIQIAEPSADTISIVKNAEEKGKFTLVAPAVDFSISCIHDNKTVDISKFNTYVNRMIAIPEGVDPTKITTGVVVNTDGKVRHVPTKITLIDSKYYAIINSMTNSTYTVIWNPIEFSDVVNHWAKDAVNDMGSRMIVTGVGDGTYHANSNITRAEFATIMVRALGLQEGIGDNKFNDVKEKNWYCEYVETASSYGIITGYGNGNFAPNDKITREQAMVMIARAMKLTELNVDLSDAEISTLLGGYTDSANASKYAKQSIAACLKYGLISGSEKKSLTLKNSITRGEVAVIVQRLLQKSNLI